MADNSLVFGANVVFDEQSIVRQWESAQRAIRSKPVTVQINDNASRPLGQISRNAAELDRSIGAASARVVAFGAAAGALFAVQRAMVELVKSTIDVQEAFAKINANLGLSKEGLQAYGQEVFNAARNSGSAFNDAAKAAEELSKQNLTTAESQKRLNDALILSRLSGETGVETVKQLTTEVAAFGQEGLNTTQIINKLAAVQSQFGVGAKDISEALGRVGASASQAGVTFDQLVSLITSLERTTGRSGAAIGDALNSIFQRTRSPEAIKDLESLGIAVKDTEGKVLPAIEVLKNLAAVYPLLSQSQKQLVEQQSGGIFNTNQLKAALGDLNKENGIFAQTQIRVAGATNEATKQNDAYNKTLSAQINQAKVSISQLFANIGNAGVGSALGGGLKAFNGILDVFNQQKGQESGQTFGQGLVKGIANVLTGPALVSSIIVIGSILTKVLSTSLDQLKNVIGLNNAAKERVAVESQINALLGQATELEISQYKSAKSLAEQKQTILSIDQRITAELEKQAALGAALQSEVIGSQLKNGPLSGLSNAKSPIKSFADGYVPAVQEERGSINKGIGGASSTAKPVIVPNFNFGNGKKGTIVANSDEHIIKNFAKDGDAIFNKDMVRKYGLPNGAQKITAAGGFIPSFSAEFNNYLKDIHPGYVDQFERIEKADPILGKFIKETTDLHGVEAMQVHGRLLKSKTIQLTPVKYGLGTTTFVNLDETPENIRKKLTGKFNDFNVESPFTAAHGYVPNFGVISKKVLGAYTPGRSSTTENGSSLSYNFDKEKRSIDVGFIDSKKKGDAFKLFNRLLDVSKRGNFPITSGSLIAQEDKYNPLDHVNSDNYTKLSALFPQIKYRDTDRSVTSGKARVGGKIFAFDNINHLKEQTNSIDPMAFSEGLGDSLLYKLNTKALARGYVPNFNKDLKNAIEREVLSGVPRDKIYIDKDIRLKSPENPHGLLVANKRDEPMGGAQGVDRVIHSGLDPKKNGAYARGYVPNFAVNDDARRILGLGAETLSGLGGGDARDKLVKSLDVSGINFDTSEATLKKKITKAVQDALDLSPSDIKGRGESAKAVRQLVEEIVTVRASEFSDLKAKAENDRNNRVDSTTTKSPIPLKIFDSNSRQASPEQIAEFEKNRASTAGGPGPVASDPRFIARKTQREKNELLARDRADFLTSNDDRSRDQATANISNRLLEGRKITKPQDSLLNNRFTLEGATVASQTLAPGTSPQAIKAFTDNFVKQKLASLNAGIDRELETNKSLSDLSDTQIKKILNLNTSNRSENTDVTRATLRQAPVNENGTINTNSIKSLVGLGRSSTLTDEFEVSVKKLITGGQTLEQAYEAASKEFVAAGGTAKQLAQTQIKVLNTSIGYEQALNAERQQAILTKASNDRFNQLKTQFDAEGSTFKNRFNPKFDHIDLANQFIKKNDLSGDDANIISGRGAQLQAKRNNRLTNLTLGASFALPLVAGLIPEGKGGTASGIAGGALQGAAQGAGIGGIFGPVGLAIGAAGGALVGVFNKLTKSTEELSEEFAQTNEKNRQRAGTTQNVFDAKNALNEGFKRGDSAQVIESLKTALKDSLDGLDKDLIDKVSSAGVDVNSQQAVLNELSRKADADRNQGNAKVSFKDAINPGFFTSIFRDIGTNLGNGNARNERLNTASKSLGAVIPKEILDKVNIAGLRTAQAGPVKGPDTLQFQLVNQLNSNINTVKSQFALVKDVVPGLKEISDVTINNYKDVAKVIADASEKSKNVADFIQKSIEIQEKFASQQARLEAVDKVQKTFDTFRQGASANAEVGIRAQSQIIGLNSSPQEAIAKLTELAVSKISAETDIQKSASREKLTENIIATNGPNTSEELSKQIRDLVSSGKASEVNNLRGISTENLPTINSLIVKQKDEETGLNASRQVNVNNRLSEGNLDSQLERINRIFNAFSNFDTSGADLLKNTATRDPLGGSNAGIRATAQRAFVQSQEFLVSQGANESQKDKDVFRRAKSTDQANNIAAYARTFAESFGTRPLQDRFGNTSRLATERALARIGNVDETRVDANGNPINTTQNGKSINFGIRATEEQRAQARTLLSSLREKDTFEKKGGKAVLNGADGKPSNGADGKPSNGADGKPFDAIAALKALNDKINADQAASVSKVTELLNQAVNFKIDGTIKLISTVLDPDTEKALTDSILSQVQDIVNRAVKESKSDIPQAPRGSNRFGGGVGVPQA